jgi:transcriptional regulator with XRE-family HTH domain
MVPMSAEAWREYGETMRRDRMLLGLTVREAADRAGISRNTVARLESGLPVQKASIARLCKVYGCVPTDPTTRRPPQKEGAHFRLHTNAEAVWYAVRINEEGAAEPLQSKDAGDPRERQRLGGHGLAALFSRPLRCRRESSRLIPFVVELYAKSDATADPSGERFVLGLRGRTRVCVGDESFEVGEGECATYDGTVSHWIEPVEPIGPGVPGPQVLQIYMP